MLGCRRVTVTFSGMRASHVVSCRERRSSSKRMSERANVAHVTRLLPSPPAHAKPNSNSSMTSLDHDVPPLTLSSVSPQEERDPFFELVDSFARRTHELKCLSTLHKHQRQFDAAEYQHQLHGLHEQLSEVERLLTNVRMYIELESQFVPLAKVRRTCVCRIASRSTEPTMITTTTGVDAQAVQPSRERAANTRATATSNTRASVGTAVAPTRAVHGTCAEQCKQQGRSLASERQAGTRSAGSRADAGSRVRAAHGVDAPAPDADRGAVAAALGARQQHGLDARHVTSDRTSAGGRGHDHCRAARGTSSDSASDTTCHIERASYTASAIDHANHRARVQCVSQVVARPPHGRQAQCRHRRDQPAACQEAPRS